MKVHEVRDYSKRGDALPIPNLIDVQIESYQKFLQKEVGATALPGTRGRDANEVQPQPHAREKMLADRCQWCPLLATDATLNQRVARLSDGRAPFS